jgi:hypothetical protein
MWDFEKGLLGLSANQSASCNSFDQMRAMHALEYHRALQYREQPLCRCGMERSVGHQMCSSCMRQQEKKSQKKKLLLLTRR